MAEDGQATGEAVGEAAGEAKELPLADRLRKIDREHEMLLSMQDQLLTALNQHFRQKTIEKMIHILKMYVRFHFELEEQTMALCQYDRLCEHKAEHGEFWVAMQAIETKFKGGRDVYEDIRKFFVRLAGHHISQSDEMFLQYARTLL